MVMPTWTSLLDWTWIFTGVIGLITLFIVRHLLQVRSLPPGPFPLPLLGNLLALRGKSFFEVLSRAQKEHKDVFTLWLGYRPTIFFCNWDLCHEALIVKRNDFAGRVIRRSSRLFLEGHEDVAFTDFGPVWETLRKALATAVRKYSGTTHLAELVADVVDRSTEALLIDGKPTNANNLAYLLIYNVLASATFGQRFEVDDPKFLELKNTNEKINENLGVGLPPDALPLLAIFYRRREKELEDLIAKFHAFIRENMTSHLKSYQSGDIRDFTDAIISTREEAEAENKENLKYLSVGNLTQTLVDLFTAGTDTTRVYLLWTFLLICDQPKIQRRMQAEIDENIGARLPAQNDKYACPYVNAVMTEVLRFRPVVDFTLEHQTICDTEIGGYRLPKGTSCLFYIKGPQTETEHWNEPDVLKPERFLDENGKFINTRITGYMPFGLGRRACPGEKLALADAFLIVTRLLQKYDLELEHGPGSVSKIPHSQTFSRNPEPFKLIVKKRDVNI